MVDELRVVAATTSNSTSIHQPTNNPQMDEEGNLLRQHKLRNKEVDEKFILIKNFGYS